MGAIYEVLAPATERGARVDLGLQRLRGASTVTRAHLTVERGRPGVVREFEAAPSPALDASLAALGASLCAVDDPVFARVQRVARAVDGPTVALVTEYIDGRPGNAPDDPTLRVRAVRNAALSLIDGLARLHEHHGITHGAIRPRALLLHALDAEGTPRSVRAFDLGVGAVAQQLAAERMDGRAAASLEGAFEGAASLGLLPTQMLCTATTWGAPGYTPVGHFAAAVAPTHGTDLYGALVSCWELLSKRALIEVGAIDETLPWARRAMHHALACDAALARWLDAHDRRAQLRAALTEALPGAHAGSLGSWVEFFDASLARGAADPNSLSAPGIRAGLLALPDPYATAATMPVLSMEGEDDVDVALDAGLPSVIALEPGREYRAEVVLDYFSGDEPSGASVRALRFRHVAMLGEGAMGSVHRVDIVRAGEAPLAAALKLALDDSVHNRDALLREAHVLRAQRLDGVAQFLALVELPGRSLALLMSFQPGRPLDRILAERRLTTAEAMALGRRLLGVLVALHADVSPDDAAEVVHGDIKPGNVMVPLDTRDVPDFGAATLIDFGVSRLRLRIATPPATTTARGAAQVLGGTTGYMPIGHLSEGATPASDVFAVAALLYESLTGRMPWTVANADQLSPFGLAFATERAMKSEPPRSLSLRDVPPWRRNLGWNRFFRTALAHGDPTRIPAARDALHALDAIRRDVAFPVAMLALALVAGSLGAWWFRTAYCPQSQQRCDGVCVDLAQNNLHCGACGNPCGAGARCVAGVCSLSCTEGLSLCDSACRDLSTDRANCGACGHGCASGEVCSAGRCAVSCGGGLSICGDACRDLRTDRANCGACRHACASGEVCTAGHCVTSCAGGFTNCGGVCRDLTTDRAHCGGCGRACDAGRVCSNGRCVTSCTEGLTDCAGSCRDTQTDRAHCGACNTACGAGENCVAGRCRQECPPGLALCGGRCRDTSADTANCGACEVRCAGGQRCEGGRCVVTCASGLGACGDVCRDLSSDRAHCGACNNACGAGLVCEGGRCAVVCAGGLSACDGVCRDLARDEDHCGSCEHRCDRGLVCEGGRCALACGAGLSACGGRCRDTSTDEEHCGACNNPCGRGEACVESVCKPLQRAPVFAPQPVVDPSVRGTTVLTPVGTPVGAGP